MATEEPTSRAGGRATATGMGPKWGLVVLCSGRGGSAPGRGVLMDATLKRTPWPPEPGAFPGTRCHRRAGPWGGQALLPPP